MLSPFVERLRDYLRAGYPALAVLTHEEERLLGDLRTLRTIGWSFVAWSVARGWVDADGRALNQGQRDPVRAFEALTSLPEKTLAVFFDLHPYLAQIPELVRTVRDTLPTAKATQRPLLFCSPELTVPVEWEKDVAVLDYALPSPAGLSGLLEELVGPARVALPAEIRGAMLEAARGLTWNEAENAFALALMRDRERMEAMPRTVQTEKTTRVRTSGLLDPAMLAAALTDLGFSARAIEWHEVPAWLRGSTIEVPGYAHLIVRGRHVGPGANDLGFVRGPEGAFHALVGVMEQRTRGWHGPYDQAWLGRLAAAYAVRHLAAQYQAKGWRVAITRQPDGVVELVAEG